MRTADFIHDLAAEAVELCSSLAAHDLPGMAVYVLPLSSLDERPAVASECTYAFTSRTLDLEMHRDGQIPRWLGRGFCCVINDEKMLATGRSNNACRTLFRLDWLGAAVHELAHAMIYGREWYIGGSVLRHRIYAESRERARSKQPPPDWTAPWASHDAPWIRAALHLCHRANALHVPLNGERVGVAGQNYGLSEPAKYSDALGGERFAFEGMSIRNVLATPAPAAFERLFSFDTRKG